MKARKTRQFSKMYQNNCIYKNVANYVSLRYSAVSSSSCNSTNIDQLRILCTKKAHQKTSRYNLALNDTA